MAKLCLAKLLETRKQRDAAAAGLMKLEMLEQVDDALSDFRITYFFQYSSISAAFFACLTLVVCF